MKPRVIKTQAQHAEALARIEKLMDAAPDTARGEELELLSLLVHTYEESAFPMDLPGPVEAIRFRMEQQGLRAKDLAPILGSRSKVSEVLSGRRSLSLGMIRALVSDLGIPAKVLLRCPKAA
jgi:HTH-type transcriptional regulator/antitoxin HigA